MAERILLPHTRDGICTITINRPQSLNALNSRLLAQLTELVTELEKDRAVQVVLITGAGDRAFVAGADIGEMAAMSPGQALEFSRKGQRLIQLLERLDKTVIAVVNGYALGGGLELALACDFIYAAENARFALPELSLGVIPGFGGTQNLPRLIGPNRARELIFSARMIDARQAEAWGMVNLVLPQDKLLDHARETAQAIMANGPAALSLAKEAIRSGMNMTRDEAIPHESVLFAHLFAGSEQAEGMAAFLEKRTPQFNSDQ
ncbi:enoyl-CoA hydratase/isomerase family protein [Desulfogranum mediterraneum]|uniref:enoyl-CoA hydratase/isomerase family protein n=1 Tax=Desulfogranum mediterraneum TaxID=160661 RepID=UPI00042595E4|nr:enoyl-CoA hydratase-related protein [Desulfogranum mediterraneum]